ncbi:hypothetical protein L1787_16685 [Acuticoccus sp. M5D2P5]|uniref:hypothetical protein n=1 Tax=Acuticoccus kalidii TaxID=2910977 RepID=UPI001F331850|nr:hypothetical protein [Acuticoccus kalidii]MCF3935042.1 hypothetical protein [Acuticoccus kalidii]
MSRRDPTAWKPTRCAMPSCNGFATHKGPVGGWMCRTHFLEQRDAPAPAARADARHQTSDTEQANLFGEIAA